MSLNPPCFHSPTHKHKYTHITSYSIYLSLILYSLTVTNFDIHALLQTHSPLVIVFTLCRALNKCPTGLALHSHNIGPKDQNWSNRKKYIFCFVLHVFSFSQATTFSTMQHIHCQFGWRFGCVMLVRDNVASSLKRRRPQMVWYNLSYSQDV